MPATMALSHVLSFFRVIQAFIKAHLHSNSADPSDYAGKVAP